MARPRLQRIPLALGLSLLVLILIEGASSALVFALEVYRGFERPIQERHHTVYDPDLGWVNTPGLDDPDLYAPGRGFTSNSRGFRNRVEFAREVPPGRVRVICAGDSFTIGYGVDDADSWPARLQAADPRIEAVNMGQGGYGVDQAWLWYQRDGLALDHDVLLFAFIGNDFERMRSREFWGYGKPLVRERDGLALVENVPVPRGSMRFPLWTQNARLLEELRTFELARRALGKLTGRAPGPTKDQTEEQTERAALAIFGELRRQTAERGVELVLVLLPNLVARDRDRIQAIPDFARRALERAEADGLRLFDLTEEFAPLDPARRQELFIRPRELALPGAAGHYNADGNEFVARAIHARLAALGLLEPRER